MRIRVSFKNKKLNVSDGSQFKKKKMKSKNQNEMEKILDFRSFDIFTLPRGSIEGNRSSLWTVIKTDNTDKQKASLINIRIYEIL